MNNERKRRLTNEEGFTLMELMVVLLIIGLLGALVAPRFFKHIEPSKREAAKAQIVLLSTALDQFSLDTGRYPTSSEGLQALISNPGVQDWAGPYLRKTTVPKDPWQGEYRYEAPGSHGLDFDLLSYSRDGSPGGEGDGADIVSWE